MSLLALLPNNALVEYAAEASDGFGGQTRTWATRHAAYACRVYQSKGEVVRLGSGEEAQSTHKFVGQDAEVHAGDRMTIGGIVYDVLGPGWPANRVYGASASHHVEGFLRAHTNA
jgi:hypothetical protein